jgi:hypothetical protein
MPKIAFRPKLGLNKKNLKQLELVNSIIEEYRKMGYRLTLRQLYYQLVSRDVIANDVKEYDKLSNLLTKGRMGGVVDWDAIEDRIRQPRLPYAVEGVDHAIDEAYNHYRIDRQEDQPNYIELWVEKDALSSVLWRKSKHYHINLMVNRGYSSCTAMYDAYCRFKAATDRGQEIHILYCGDFDPSGRDMLRDIDERLTEFGAKTIMVHSIALTMKQIKAHKPPPNPAKITDPRAKDYIIQHGNKSWEVDALRPETLHEIIDTNIEKLLDLELFNKRMEREEAEKVELALVPKQRRNINEVQKYLKERMEQLDRNMKSEKQAKEDLRRNKVLQAELKSVFDLIK